MTRSTNDTAEQSPAVQDLVKGLRLVVSSAAELMTCPDLDTTLQRAMVFIRDDLGLERNGIFLVDLDRYVSGTYGINMQGQITDIHHLGFKLWEIPQVPPDWFEARSSLEPLWKKFEAPFYDWDGEKQIIVGEGWNCFTPIYGAEGLIGIVSNDAAISGAPFDEVKQELLAVYCSLLGKIMDRKRVEDAIRRTLAREQELVELKSRLIQSISHEFRTPMAVILTSAHALARYGTRLSEERTEAHRQAIGAQVEFMANRLDDLLTIEKIDRKYFDRTLVPLDLVDFCSAICEHLSTGVTPRRAIEFSWRGEEVVRLTDEWLLNLILVHLLRNAVMYTQDGSQVHLELSMEEERIVIRVADHGLGIPPEDREAIFDAFYRGRNVEHIHGIGMGLSIVHRAVKAFGGSISVESELGEGTAVTVTLPTIKAVSGWR